MKIKKLKEWIEELINNMDKHFKLEFNNRIDDIIVFSTIQTNEIEINDKIQMKKERVIYHLIIHTNMEISN